MRVKRTFTLAAGGALGLLLTGCGSIGQTVNTTAATTAAGSGATGTHASVGSNGQAAAAKSAGVGDAIDVTDASGNKLAVTVVKLDGKAQATDGFSTPTAGDQYYAVQVQIKNVGSGAWSDAPSNCLVVRDGKGQTFQADVVESLSSGPLMNTTVNLAAGDATLGWVVFDVPVGDKVTEVQFTPDSGMSDDTAQWSVS